MRPPLLVTGGPAAAKTSTARRLAFDHPRAAVTDVDGIRHLTDEEFEDLHTGQGATNDLVDEIIDVDELTLPQQVDAVAQVWPASRMR